MHPLKWYILKNQIKQVEFAKKIGVTPSFLSHLLKYKYFPSRKTAKKISELTGIPVIKLLYPEDDDA